MTNQSSTLQQLSNLKIIQSGTMHISRGQITRLTFAAMITLVSACAAPPLRLAEEAPQLHDEGTLLIGEVIRSLTLSEILDRYSSSDLEMAGWTESEVKDGNAVILSNFGQHQGYFDVAHVYYALIQWDSTASLQYNKACFQPGPRPGSCTYGGDVVSFRVVRKPLNMNGPSGLNVVELVVEPRGQVGDCVYLDRGRTKNRNYRYALICDSLSAKGWEWYGDEFVKLPAVISN
jgi:hypothetical protein